MQIYTNPSAPEGQASLGLGDHMTAIPLFSWPGGKRQSARFIASHLPGGTSPVVSPFLGGGAVELRLAAEGRPVEASDNNPDLIRLWEILLYRPQALADALRDLRERNLDRETMQGLINSRPSDPDLRAVYQYLRVRCGLYGAADRATLTTERQGTGEGERWRKKFRDPHLRDILAFRAPNLRVRHADYRETLERFPDRLAYLDPPYIDTSGRNFGTYSNLYGKQSGIDPEELAAILRSRRNWILSYNDCEFVRETYRDYRIIPVRVRWTSGTKRGDLTEKAGEVLIINLDT